MVDLDHQYFRSITDSHKIKDLPYSINMYWDFFRRHFYCTGDAIFEKKIQSKEQIFSFHLIPFGSKSIDQKSLKKTEKDWQNLSSALLEIQMIKGLIFELFPDFQRLSNAPRRHIFWRILKQWVSYER